MFTMKQARDYLKISQSDLDRHLALSSDKGYRFTNEKGEQVFHDGDIERIVMRLAYAEQLTRERQDLINQNTIASIDL